MPLFASSIWQSPAPTILPCAGNKSYSTGIMPRQHRGSIASASPTTNTNHLGLPEARHNNESTIATFTPHANSLHSFQQYSLSSIQQGDATMDYSFVHHTDPGSFKEVGRRASAAGRQGQQNPSTQDQIEQEQQQQEQNEQDEDPERVSPNNRIGPPNKRSHDEHNLPRTSSATDLKTSARKRLRIKPEATGMLKRSDVLKLYENARSPTRKRQKDSTARSEGRPSIASTPNSAIGTPISESSVDEDRRDSVLAKGENFPVLSNFSAAPFTGRPDPQLGGQTTQALSRPSAWQSNVTILPFTSSWPTSNYLRAVQPSLDAWNAYTILDIHSSLKDQLKRDCRSFFYTPAMRFWAGKILSSDITFISSLCVSSIHRDVFLDSMPEQSNLTRQLRIQSFTMMNSLLGEESTRVRDTTVMSVMQLLMCEIVTGTEGALKAHEMGMRIMIRMRNGLEGLGMEGVLARVLTGTSFLSALYRETQPDEMYVLYAKSLPPPQPLPVNPRQQLQLLRHPLPSSPFYCPGPNEPFSGLADNPLCAPQTVALLRDMKIITDAFLRLDEFDRPYENPSQQQRYQASHDEERLQLLLTINSIHARTSSLNSSNQPTAPAVWLYQSVLVAAKIYTTALQNRMPFSAALLLCPEYNTHMPATRHPNSHHPSNISTPLTQHLRIALGHCDFSGSLRELADVLLWVCLIGGAAARGRRERNWIVALGIRCFVNLVFQHGGIVVEGLKRGVKVMEILGTSSGSVVGLGFETDLGDLGALVEGINDLT